ncbi:thiamine pyrophosphate-binding protein [Actinocorallia herbida]|uniref:thiamine pyrophosphate-binding protein n=1 Tax=Actinocorallia herbida TaxID=58109 RepID=UPI003CCC77BB
MSASAPASAAARSSSRTFSITSTSPSSATRVLRFTDGREPDHNQGNRHMKVDRRHAPVDAREEVRTRLPPGRGSARPVSRAALHLPGCGRWEALRCRSGWPSHYSREGVLSILRALAAPLSEPVSSSSGRVPEASPKAATLAPAARLINTAKRGLLDFRHEAAAVNAADGYARVTGGLAVAAVTGRPGFANGFAGIRSDAPHSPLCLVAELGFVRWRTLDEVAVRSFAQTSRAASPGSPVLGHSFRSRPGDPRSPHERPSRPRAQAHTRSPLRPVQGSARWPMRASRGTSAEPGRLWCPSPRPAAVVFTTPAFADSSVLIPVTTPPARTP